MVLDTKLRRACFILCIICKHNVQIKVKIDRNKTYRLFLTQKITR